jgi:hypothetical protein
MHFKKINSKLNATGLNNVSNCFNSDDNTTWCQRFVMPVFGVVFSQILPTNLLTCVCKVLNMCTMKKLQLPIELLNKFSENRDLQSQVDPGINELKSQFLGNKTGNQKLIDPFGTMLYNTSNFMQGIFHYTSSLIHSAYMMVMTDFGLKFARSKGIQCIMTWMVSSDDSWLATSSLHLSDSDAKAAMFTSTLISCVKTECYPLMCAMNSTAKSTSPTHLPIMEFQHLPCHFGENGVHIRPHAAIMSHCLTYLNIRTQLYAA